MRYLRLGLMVWLCVWSWPAFSAFYQQSTAVKPATELAVKGQFGRSAISVGERLLVGAPCNDSTTGCTDGGRVFILEPTTSGWQTLAELSSPNTTDKATERFGFALAQHGDWLAVSAPYANKTITLYDENDQPTGTDNTQFGLIYLYKKDSTQTAGWAYHATLTLPIDAYTPAVGFKMSMSDAGLFVAAPFLDEYLTSGKNENVGAVYVATVSSSDVWSFVTNSNNKPLPLTNGCSGDAFGWALASGQDSDGHPMLMVGSPGGVEKANGSCSANQAKGIVRMYKQNTTTQAWEEAQTLSPVTGLIGDAFGSSIAFDASHLFVGALYAKDAEGQTTGTVHVYDWNAGTKQWVFSKIIEANSDQGNQRFGTSLALSDAGLLVGATNSSLTQYSASTARDVSYTGAGKVYQFEHMNNAWTQTQILQRTDAQNTNDAFGFTPLWFKHGALTYPVIGSHRITPAGENQQKGMMFAFTQADDVRLNGFDLTLAGAKYQAGQTAIQAGDELSLTLKIKNNSLNSSTAPFSATVAINAEHFTLKSGSVCTPVSNAQVNTAHVNLDCAVPALSAEQLFELPLVLTLTKNTVQIKPKLSMALVSKTRPFLNSDAVQVSTTLNVNALPSTRFASNSPTTSNSITLDASNIDLNQTLAIFEGEDVETTNLSFVIQGTYRNAFTCEMLNGQCHLKIQSASALLAQDADTITVGVRADDGVDVPSVLANPAIELSVALGNKPTTNTTTASTQSGAGGFAGVWGLLLIWIARVARVARPLFLSRLLRRGGTGGIATFLSFIPLLRGGTATFPPPTSSLRGGITAFLPHTPSLRGAKRRGNLWHSNCAKFFRITGFASLYCVRNDSVRKVAVSLRNGGLERGCIGVWHGLLTAFTKAEMNH